MSTLTRRAHRPPFADVFGWLKASLGLIRPAAGHPMRVEDYVKDGRYVLRAELPGIDGIGGFRLERALAEVTLAIEEQERTDAARLRLAAGTPRSGLGARLPH